MKILHLIQPLAAPDHWLFRRQGGVSGEAALLFLCDAITDTLNVPCSHHVVVMGGSASKQLAKSVGLRDFTHLAPALGRASRCGPALRAALPSFGRLDAIVAWGASAAAVLAKLPTRPETSHFYVDVASGRLSLGEAPTQSKSVTLPWLTAGATRFSLASGALSQSGDARNERPASARRQLSIAEHEPTVLVMSDDACPAFAPDCLLALLSLTVCDHPVTLLLPRTSEDFTRALRGAQDGAYIHRIVPTPPEMSQRELLAAADVAMIAPHQYSMPGLQHDEDGEDDEEDRAQPMLPAARFWLEATRAGIPAIVPQPIAAWMGVETAACLAHTSRATDLTRALLPLLESAEARLLAAARAAKVLEHRGTVMNANESLVRAMEHLAAMSIRRVAL